jgi:ATP/maltotriose-dependent transcriptional regulator MalT
VAERTSGTQRARELAARGSWREAYEELSAIEPSVLSPVDLETLGDAAWWLSKRDESIAARQRAYAGYAAAEDQIGSAGMAARLAVEHFARGESAVGAGWLAKAHRHADRVTERAEHGLLLMIDATVARFQGELDRAIELADRAAELGERFADPDLLPMAIHTQGLLAIAVGRVPDGLALLDEAMTSVLAGEVSPFFTGVIYCDVIGACLELADVGRAGEWDEAARVWCETLPPESPYPGMCRVNRAEVARLRGAWALADEEAAHAVDELLAWDPFIAAQALCEIGEIHRRQGDLEGAEVAFERAREIGVAAQPGLALLRLSQGKADTAAQGLEQALSEEDDSPLRRARLLSAQVEVSLARSDLDGASEATDRLGELATAIASPVLAATADDARGTLLLARGDAAESLALLRHARDAWRELKLPYEAARSRASFGLALRAVGREEDAIIELRAARGAFERLGAGPDAARVAASIDGVSSALPAGLTPREVEVLRLVAAGRSNRQIAGELVISEHTVARHLQNMFTKLDVSSRAAATAFAFEHDLV